ncbi:MAG: GNAT family N-acetyltransferase [Acetatifactor sp.]
MHALWCANVIPYPMTSKKLQDVLEKDAQDWGGYAYVATEDDGIPVGFFVLAANFSTNSGFLKFVIVDNKLRGKGYGTSMIKLMLKFAFDITGVSSVQLNVFDINDSAKKGYSNIGFIEDSIVEHAFTYKDKLWGRCHMVITK